MKLAVIAHDGKKADMVAFLNRHYEFMHSANIEIIATGTTGKHAQDAGLKVERLLSGPLGEMPRLQHKWQNIKYKWCCSSETRLGNTLTNRTCKC